MLAQKTDDGGWQLLPVSSLNHDGEWYTFTANFTSTTNSCYAYVLAEEQPAPLPKKESSSRNYGASVWLPATAEPTPTAEATPEPALAQPAASPVNQPPQQTSTPAPAAGIIAGLGAALVFGLRRK